MFMNFTDRTLLASLIFITCVVGCSKDDGSTVGSPTGSTGNEWTSDDFAGTNSNLAVKGGPEFVDYCKEAGTSKIEGKVLEKFQEILKKYPVTDEEEYDHFGVVVREGLIEIGMLPAGDPDRYQYTVSHLSAVLSSQ